jgi:hypothetical protein
MLPGLDMSVATSSRSIHLTPRTWSPHQMPNTMWDMFRYHLPTPGRTTLVEGRQQRSILPSALTAETPLDLDCSLDTECIA